MENELDKEEIETLQIFKILMKPLIKLLQSCQKQYMHLLNVFITLSVMLLITLSCNDYNY